MYCHLHVFCSMSMQCHLAARTSCSMVMQWFALALSLSMAAAYGYKNMCAIIVCYEEEHSSRNFNTRDTSQLTLILRWTQQLGAMWCSLTLLA
mmetsp:Transcript_90233/g.140901  ORF Transcript_90233/g.140901 Transcript_90233/m.140901 type:complete len:93 (+) Transcript_90233:61-339(+)